MTKEECVKYLESGVLSPLVEFMDFQLHNGEYGGNDEPTLVMKMRVNSSAGEVITARSVVQLMCSKFTQDCIPFRQEGANEDDGVLMWNRSVEDRTYTFDKQYFIDPFRVKMEAEAYGNKVYTIGDLRRLTSHLSDDDLLVIEIHEGERYEDLYIPTTDLIDGVELDNGKIVREFRLCI